MHYLYINPDKHLIMLIIHNADPANKCTPFPGERISVRAIKDYMAGLSARRSFSGRLNTLATTHLERAKCWSMC